MNLLETENIRLRALEQADLEALYRWENDTSVWGVSGTLLPFSRRVLTMFIEQQSQDIYETRQTRFIIERIADRKAVGAVDIFDFDPFNMRAGVGILIYDMQDRGKGYAADALTALKRYAFGILRLHQLYCSIPVDNAASITLFEDVGFTSCGVRRDWLKSSGGWKDEILYQLINADGK